MNVKFPKREKFMPKPVAIAEVRAIYGRVADELLRLHLMIVRCADEKSSGPIKSFGARFG